MNGRMALAVEAEATQPEEKMTVHRLDPAQDPRWSELLQQHPRASVYHTPGWLEALRRTYDYEPMVFTTSPPDAKLRNGVVFCRVNSWLTGRRLVSLPFSDHCEPLVNSAEELGALCVGLQQLGRAQRCRYVELRPTASQPAGGAGFAASETFYMHRLDLQPEVDKLFRNLHKDSTQRKIRRAEREGLVYRQGREPELLRDFYLLQVRTRRRQGLPPQPLKWFQNLAGTMGSSLVVRVANKDAQPVAAILTLSFRNVVVYKYGCSDERHHNLGGMALLFWKMIQEARAAGATEIDFGRSDLNNQGLVTFKEHWNAQRSPLTYWRYPAQAPTPSGSDWKSRLPATAFSRMPDSLLIQSGKLLYRHFG